MRFTCSLHSSNSKKFHSDNIDEDGYKDAINDALTRILKIIGFLHKYDTVNIKGIIVKSLYEFSAADEALNDTGLSTLMHQWVKVTTGLFDNSYLFIICINIDLLSSDPL